MNIYWPLFFNGGDHFHMTSLELTVVSGRSESVCASKIKFELRTND
jgi:hypothetical protein